MTDKECLLQLIAHLGLNEQTSIRAKLRQRQYRINRPHACSYTEIQIACGGGEIGAEIVFEFNADGSVNQHCVYGPPDISTDTLQVTRFGGLGETCVNS